tara:strand:+ start:367 stop:2217 length:1851 start_codon:yes stop_codon:yes gene_type:complete
MESNLILGLSGYYHDCSYCLVNEEGQILIHCELERDARIKEIPGNPILYYIDDVHTEKYDKRITGLSTFLHQDSMGLFETISRINSSVCEFARENGWEKIESGIPNEIKEQVKNVLKPIGEHANMCISETHISRFIRLMAKNLTFDIFGHHHCHAAEAYFRCGSPDALVCTADGGGFDFSTTDGRPIETHLTAWNGVTGEGISCVDQDKIISLGSVYDLTTSYLGFSYCYPIGSQNGSVMGMAAYGNKERFEDLYKNEFLFQNTSALNMNREKVLESRTELEERIMEIMKDSGNVLQDKFDIAASLQEAFEKRFIDYIKKLLTMESLKKKKVIVLAGGASLNCAFVGKLASTLESPSGSMKVLVSNVPYDAGLSIGSALLAANKNHGTQPANLLSEPAIFTPYLGRQYKELDCISALRSLRQKFEINSDERILYEEMSRGKIIAIFNGRSESGRRALGNRSLFADPRIKEIRNIMNEKVKHRPIWRPFAPLILEEDISDWFVKPIKSPYMSHTCQFKESMKEKVSSVVHNDGTGRLQTVNSKQNPWLHSFLNGWKEYSGVPILINTSFNDNEPIVETPYHAVACFQRTNIDILYFPEYRMIAYKNKNTEKRKEGKI